MYYSSLRLFTAENFCKVGEVVLQEEYLFASIFLSVETDCLCCYNIVVLKILKSGHLVVYLMMKFQA